MSFLGKASVANAQLRATRRRDLLALTAFVAGWLLVTWGLSLYLGRGILWVGGGALLLGFVGYRVVGVAVWEGALVATSEENPRG